MATFAGSVARYPARISFACYLALILLGGTLLALPVCHAPNQAPISLLDALFTSTSAVCVTGLSVRSTGEHFSFVGQLVILALIQVGGIGIMTITTFITFTLGGRESLRARMVVSESVGGFVVADLRWVLGYVILMTLLCEAIGFAFLATRNLIEGEQSVSYALWHAAFHSISAFCNAGFGLADDSLVQYRGSVTVNFTVMALIIAGGIGFPVLLDVTRNWGLGWNGLWSRLHMHSKFMLLGSAILIGFGMISILAFEWDNSLADLPLAEKLMASLFQSVTCRTAGFNTVSMQHLTNATLFIMVLLMLVGAGPCSTAGGFKVSTVSVLVMRAWSTFRGSTAVHAFRRSIPLATVGRAMTTVLLYMAVVAACLTAMLAYEQSQTAHAEAPGTFLEAMFEVVSALGTVGLSTGLTPTLSGLGKWILIVAMFVGRLGPISVAAVFSSAEYPRKIDYPQEEPLIG
ncbi:MAG: TrkH family potassium uptake protein, partial [Planctomycetota bacterium]